MKTMVESYAVDENVNSRAAQRVMFAVTAQDGISRCALRKAARVAGGLGAQLELYYCAFDLDIMHPGPLNSRSPEQGVHEYVQQRQRQLCSLAQDLRSAGVSVHTRVEWNARLDQAIVREVLRWQPALLVVEAFHTSPGLIETCPCPLLLIRNARSYPSHPQVVAAVDPMHSHAKTAMLDDAILTAASAISNAVSGELHLFHARIPWAVASRQARGPQWVPDVAKDESQVCYEHAVASRVGELARRYSVPTLRTHLVDGDVTECLPSFSRAEAFDIVAMGVLSRSFLERVLIGNTARRVLDELECDVLIIKQPGFQTPVTPGAGTAE